MLIKSLDLRNFRKYSTLIINDIPESGIITLVGLNESGKTSIGEAICFVLFGRTFFQDEKSLYKLVFWGADIAEVTLTFKTGSGDIYSLWRSVNADGETDIRLSQHDENTHITNDNTAITDKETVAQALDKLLNFDFDAFSNSFYLAQRELTSPDPQSYSIKQMAGISAYSKITADLEVSNQESTDSIAELQPLVDSSQTQLDEIDLDETWLPELVDAEETLNSEQQERRKLSEHLQDKGKLYANNFSTFHSLKKTSGIFGILSKLYFLTTIVLSVVWSINHYYPEALTELLLKNFSGAVLVPFSVFAEKWLPAITIISLIATLLSGFIYKKSNTRMLSLNQDAMDFSALLGDAYRYVKTLVEPLLPERVVKLLQGRDANTSTLLTPPATLLLLPPKEQFNNLIQLMKGASDFKADPEEMSAAAARLSEVLQKQDRGLVDLNTKIIDDINKEKRRADQAGSLRVSLHSRLKSIKECNYKIETQTIAVGIMQRAAANLIATFNQSILTISAKILPVFTESRYSKLKIAEDFSVQIYSDEKHGYMDFDEISSGTQRQVMLSLRIAMSEQLSINSGNEEQFIFLDEPFAFFDKSRTKASLENLPKVSDVIKQIWISAQELPDNTKAAKQIECPADKSELIV